MRAAAPDHPCTPRPQRRHALGALMVALAPWPARGEPAADHAPLFGGMGSHTAPDVSRSALARRYFAQAMVLTWGFNPAEAARSFGAALRADPACAPAAWGLAWALGPTINADMAPSDAARVDEALRRARALAATAAPRWRGLIGALVARHPTAGTASVDDEAYAHRMRALAQRHPRDADVLTLAAEAAMNLHPYDWWQRDGRARPWTREIAARLEAALTLAPDHPGAHHSFVHLMETSPSPQRALASADRLATLVPGSGHLLHMPAHIYMRVGRYAAASAANERSIAADRRYLEQVDTQGAYRVGYLAHNHHFLWASASMEGRSRVAIEAARAAYPAACGSTPGARGSGTLQHYQVLPLYALVRFGRWHEILNQTPPPEGNDPYPLALWHYARATASTRTGRLGDAQAALAALQSVADDPALASVRVKSINAAAALVRVALLTLRADIAAAQGDHERALSWLREAVETEDTLEHDEPHLWLAPTRHALGAALLDAGHAADAERVFRQDLQHYPDNGWSLTGLAQAQAALGRAGAAAVTQRRLRSAWQAADVALPAARF